MKRCVTVETFHDWPRKKFSSLTISDGPVVAEEAELAGQLHLEVGYVVDVGHAAKPLHQEGHDPERQRLSLDEHPVRLAAEERRHERRGREAEVVRQPNARRVAGRRVEPGAAHWDAVDRLPHPPTAAICRERDAARIVRHAREHLDLDPVALELAREGLQPELWRTELRGVVLA
jgi:hypothetical protein